VDAHGTAKTVPPVKALAHAFSDFVHSGRPLSTSKAPVAESPATITASPAVYMPFGV
jgi:hypothetical protein